MLAAGVRGEREAAAAARERDKKAHKPDSQPASSSSGRETKLGTREQGNTPNKQPTISNGNTGTCDLSLIIVPNGHELAGGLSACSPRI